MVDEARWWQGYVLLVLLLVSCASSQQGEKVGSLESRGGLSPTGDQAREEFEPLPWCQQVSFLGPGVKVNYWVGIGTVRRDGTEYAVEICNGSQDSIHILTKREWRFFGRGKTLVMSYGESGGHYGSEIPMLTPLEQGECLTTRGKVDFVGDSPQFVSNVEVGFYAILSGSEDVVARIYELDGSGDVWFVDGDLDLTERFYEDLKYSKVAFPYFDGMIDWGALQ